MAGAVEHALPPRPFIQEDCVRCADWLGLMRRTSWQTHQQRALPEAVTAALGQGDCSTGLRVQAGHVRLRRCGCLTSAAKIVLEKCEEGGL